MSGPGDRQSNPCSCSRSAGWCLVSRLIKFRDDLRLPSNIRDRNRVKVIQTAQNAIMGNVGKKDQQIGRFYLRFLVYYADRQEIDHPSNGSLYSLDL